MLGPGHLYFNKDTILLWAVLQRTGVWIPPMGPLPLQPVPTSLHQETNQTSDFSAYYIIPLSLSTVTSCPLPLPLDLFSASGLFSVQSKFFTSCFGVVYASMSEIQVSH